MAEIKHNKGSRINKLLGFFGLTLKSRGVGGGQIIHPAQKPKDDSNVNPYATLKAISWPSDIQKSYDYFLGNLSSFGASTQAERINRYKDCEFMIRNDGIMASAALIYTEEAYSVDAGQRPVQIIAKDKKTEKHFYEWLDTIGFDDNVLRDIVYNIVVYGDAFLLHKIDLVKGIESIDPLDPFIVKDKIEFSLNAVAHMKDWTTWTRNFTNKYQSLKQITDFVQNMQDKESTDYTAYFQTFLLGYELKYSTIESDEEGKALPPWALTHFRIFDTKSEFYPFGRPLFINSIARFRSYRTTEMLIDMLRVASFPKEIVKIKGGDTLTPLDRVKRIDEVRQLIENISPATNSKDDISVGERLYSMDDLFDIVVEDTSIDMDKLGDLEHKLDDLILTTGIPDSYLIPSRGNGLGGESAASLYYNNRIFQRRVEGIKIAVLQGIEDMYRLHLSITGEFEAEKTIFELNMPVSADAYSTTKKDQISDLLNLSSEVISQISQAVGMERGEKLPLAAVKKIFSYFIPIPDGEVNKWIDMFIKKEEENEEEPDGKVNPPITAQPLIIQADAEAAQGNAERKDTGFKPNGKPSITKKKENVNTLLEKLINGDDTLIREKYFEVKNAMGMNNKWIGNKITVNNSRKLMKESENKYYKYSVFSLFKKQKIIDQKKLIEQELERRKGNENKLEE